MCRFLIKLENPHFDPKTSKKFLQNSGSTNFSVRWHLSFKQKIRKFLLYFQKKTLDIKKTRIQKTYKLMDKQADGLIDKQKNWPKYFIQLPLCGSSKWLLCCTYNFRKGVVANHLDMLKRSLDWYSIKYKNLISDLPREF